MQISRAVFRYVEHELYNFDATQRAMQELRCDVMYAPPVREAVPGSGRISDPTARKAIALVTNQAIGRMTRTINAINIALARLGDEHRAIFELKYRQALPWQQVCQMIPVSERTYFRLRRELVLMVAAELGLAGTWQE